MLTARKEGLQEKLENKMNKALLYMNTWKTPPCPYHMHLMHFLHHRHVGGHHLGCRQPFRSAGASGGARGGVITGSGLLYRAQVFFKG